MENTGEKIRYFYPQDVVTGVVEGKKIAFVDLNLPHFWTDAAFARAQVDFLDGWCMARRAYEGFKQTEVMKRDYPRYYEDTLRSKKEYADWKTWLIKTLEGGILVNTPEYRVAKSEYKGRHF